ncbi:MAG: hypothetical protein ACRKGH_03770 [Dehalogenimonas sp.]
MEFEKCKNTAPAAPAPSPAVDPAEVARDDYIEYYMKEYGHAGLTPKKYQTIASFGVEFHGKGNEVLDARFKYEGYHYPAPAPKEGYKTRFGQRQKDWRQLSLAKDLYDEAVKIKKDKGNIDTTRAKSGSIHDLSPYEELLYMTGLYFASGQIGLAILYGNAANAVMTLFEPERRDPDLSQFYREQS